MQLRFSSPTNRFSGHAHPGGVRRRVSRAAAARSAGSGWVPAPGSWIRVATRSIAMTVRRTTAADDDGRLTGTGRQWIKGSSGRPRQKLDNDLIKKVFFAATNRFLGH
jgi:hypothetical protein